MNRLDPILATTRSGLAERRRERPEAELARIAARRREAGDRRGLLAALREPGLSVIAEHKRRSPSAGLIREGLGLPDVVRAYERAGAAALSILTEGPNFGGELADLTVARTACELPLLRKDFIVDPYQLCEARVAGAHAVLLIVAALQRDDLAALHAEALRIGLDVLVEVHDERELAEALDLGADIVGVNNRDLRDFSVDMRRTERLMGRMPSGVTVVSESGISSPDQLRRLGEHGVAAVLVGESLMRADDPAAALGALIKF